MNSIAKIKVIASRIEPKNKKAETFRFSSARANCVRCEGIYDLNAYRKEEQLCVHVCLCICVFMFININIHKYTHIHKHA